VGIRYVAGIYDKKNLNILENIKAFIIYTVEGVIPTQLSQVVYLKYRKQHEKYHQSR
jgi:hypothetical protein